MTFQQQQKELANKVIADLCNASIYPDGLFPHTVFVEEESEDGEPVYRHYKLISIEQSSATCILECPVTQKQEEHELQEIDLSWLITVNNWCKDLMIEEKMWREHAISCLTDNVTASLEDIIDFVDNYWQNLLSDADNITAFNRTQVQPMRELEMPLRRLLDVAQLEIPCFDQSLTYQLCVNALESNS